MYINKLIHTGCICIGLLFSMTIDAQVKNPILPGFYPDPSICRVDKEYYLVNSSFSYFPGVPIFKSTDLVHWEQIGHILDRPSQLNLTNLKISDGIYAPTIRYNNGIFYMITTLIGNGGNFYVTASNPAGPWSDPIWLPEINGIDPSFFFDEDGKVFIVNNGPPADNKTLYIGHCAIWLQEFDLLAKKFMGERKVVINGGTDLSKKPIWIEGPHIYKKNGYYYLMAAEGGTETGHSEVIFRCKSIWGPYEVFSGNPILTQRDLPTDRPSPVTCAGHADLVQTENGDWLSVFLACQPYSEGYFNTGRQTFFLPVNWSGEWPVILEKGIAIPEITGSPILSEENKKSFFEYSSNWRDDFNSPELKMEWNFIRTPRGKWYELKNDTLIIDARPVSIAEIGNPSFIGRRQQHSSCEFSTEISLESGKDMETGVVAFQNEKYFYKFVIIQESGKYFLSVSSAKGEILKTPFKEYKTGKPVFLKVKALGKEYQCEYSLNNKSWKPFGGILDGTQLSTVVSGGFVGTYFGLYAYAKTPANASFNWAKYQQIEKL